MFKGGLADNKIETTRLHTAAHLLLAALRQVLSKDVQQKGSNITEERLRFDFNWPEKLTPDQLLAIENLVNEKIKENIFVEIEELPLDEAKSSGASGVFDDRYGDKVKVYTVRNSSTSSEPPFSREICGGPHVKSTGELGRFKIIKEESSSAGVRRIKAVLQ
jgi:alanyl-tRNA synthetase